MSSDAANPIIYLITSGEAADADFPGSRSKVLDLVRVGVEAGATHIQIREKKLSTRLLIELTADAADMTSGSNTKLLVNDRADIAMAAKADGVHLTATSIPVDVIKAAFPRLTIAVSTHDETGLAKAAGAGADLAVFGPVFRTPGKPGALGLSLLAEACSNLAPFPVVALGGIDGSNCVAAMAAGAAGVAGIRSFNDINSLRAIVKIVSEWQS